MIITAEQEIHGEEDIHLHELGTIDTVFDCFTSILLIQQLQITHVISSPVATGQGVVKTAHGILGVPAPATSRIITKYQIPTLQGPVGEAATPTGVAILASLLNNLPKGENIVWQNEGIGFGKKTWEDRSNILKIRIGKLNFTPGGITLLETNLDDITGEALGSTFDLLIGKGALDVTLIPILMKKNRPGYILRVMCNSNEVNIFSELMMRATGSLGVRVQTIERHLAQRNVETINLNSKQLGGNVEVRLKKGIRSKIEADDIQRLADLNDLTFLEVEQLLYKELYQS
jgi:uncharacterized protein (TIGR00299 family) protein